ncbi:MAG TPA: pyruvate dehydrogenase (acetyl-transferring), homodimeric type [Gammaproteobacteria bacterium]|nr:pyruvate dehydrogenase (acetyl-transferring), homodimeric type [Gammaproteobacteria bacterium]
MSGTSDIDPQETNEWLEALESLIEVEGTERTQYVIRRLVDKARQSGVNLPFTANTAYLNTIPTHREQHSPGNPALERRIKSINRWNAMAMVVKANRKNAGLGGHIASYASAATLYEIGYNHFWHAPSDAHGGDLIFFQGHCAPGVYARAYLLGLINEQDLNNFRQDVEGKGLTSYPHPWLMPRFWQFPTVSMGLGPIMAIYQARFMRYLENRGLCNTQNRKVWAFMGDGEMDEPEAFGAASLASRESLDNLIFVVNCNLQRLDGPVRGNGKIIQELESDFRGAGWNVIKVIWGSYWDPLLSQDSTGLLQQRMEEAVDGDYQSYKAFNGGYVREHFFGKYPELQSLVSSMSDEDIWRLNRGGHDPHKVFAAYAAAIAHEGQPTVILCKTVKGYGMGEAGEGKNITHQQKKMGEDALKQFRDRFNIPISDEAIADTPFYKPPEDSPEMIYLRERTEAMGGFLPQRREKAGPMTLPDLSIFDNMLAGTGERAISTTMAFVRMLTALTRDKEIGARIVPIIPDEARTFGMEGMFRQLGIYSSVGQLYEPVDHDQFMYYREDKGGQILEEGINEAGAMCSWIAAATAYSSHNLQMIPFYIYYSMFGFQRVGDLAWAAGDMQARGFLLGGTAGRTTLEGEGLQHQDGHSHLLASTIPNCVSYDPTYAYELAVIIHNGMERMFGKQENVFYYISVMNENYEQPALPKNASEGIIKGMYLLHRNENAKVQLLGSGAILREVIAAGELLETEFGIEANIWSVTSFNELRREGLDCERWNMLHPNSSPRISYVQSMIGGHSGPVIAASDYMKVYADQIREFIPRSYRTFGTDGFGRSDSRTQLRQFFEVSRNFICLGALKSLAEEGTIDNAVVTDAITRLDIDPEKENPQSI